MMGTENGVAAAAVLAGAGLCLLCQRNQRCRPSRAALGGNGSKYAACKQYFVNNEWPSSMHGATLQTSNPAMQEVRNTLPTVNEADVDDKVAAAARAIFMRRDMPGSTRCDMLLQLNDLMATHQRQLPQWGNDDRDTSAGVTRRVGVTLEIALLHCLAGWAAQTMLIMKEIQHLMQCVWQTRSTYGTGSTAWEATEANWTEQDDKYLVCISGLFGRCAVDRHVRHPGDATNITMTLAPEARTLPLNTTLSQAPLWLNPRVS